MKKILHFVFVLTAISILLSSCSQLPTISIAKRHHNNGYYVDVNSKHKPNTLLRETKSSVIESVPVTVHAHSETATAHPASAIAAPSQARTQVNSSNEPVASSVKSVAPAGLKQRMTPNTMLELKNIQTISKYVISENHSKNDNNSLLWTIIVILLLLWLLSYLMGGWGLGGLLNLLLVIVIILVILMLLGVI